MTEAEKIQAAFNAAFDEAADARRAAQEAQFHAANAVAKNAQGGDEARRYAVHVECLAQYALRQARGAEYALLQAWDAWRARG